MGLTSKEYQAKCPEYTDSEAQLVQVLVQFKSLQLQTSPVLELSFQRFCAFPCHSAIVFSEKKLQLRIL